MTQDLLNQQGDQNPQETLDPNKSYLDELVGEGQKFKTTEDLAKGKWIADRYIEHKNAQFDELRSDYLRLKQDYDSRAKLEEFMEKIDQRLASSEIRNPEANEANRPTFNPDEVKSLVSNSILEHEARKSQEANWNSVKDKLIERHGSNYQNALQKQMEELGMTAEYLNSTARSNPKLLIKALGLDQSVQTENFQAPPRSLQRSSFTPSVTKRDWDYYEGLRKKDPALYWEPRTQDQMHKDHMDLGEAFETASYKRLRSMS